jgi:flagellar hook-basal body complex protein FliE
MIDPTITNVTQVTGTNPAGAAGSASQTGGAGETSFSDTLQKSIDEVSRLQQDASQAVDAVTTGQTQNVTGVMTAVEKADMAFRTLLAIRAKLMDAYDEIKGISV